MVMETAAKLNYFPHKGGCSSYFSLRKSSIMLSLTTRSTIPCLFSVMFSLTMNQPLPTLFTHVDSIVFSYTPFKQSKLGMNVIIFPLARSLHNLMSLLMECIVEEHRQQHVVTYSLKAGINKFGDQAKVSAHKEMKQLHDRSCFRQSINACLISSRNKEQWNHFCS